MIFLFVMNIGIYGVWRIPLEDFKKQYIDKLFNGEDINLNNDISLYNSNDVNLIGDWAEGNKLENLLKPTSITNFNVPVIRFSMESEKNRCRKPNKRIIDELLDKIKYKYYVGYFNEVSNIDNKIYFPIWLSFYEDLIRCHDKKYDNFDERYENWICDMTLNKGVKWRECFYKNIKSQRVCTNIGRYSYTDRVNKINIISKYLFNACFENTFESGYVTEKPVEALMAGCLPIYNGLFNNKDPNPFNMDKFFIVKEEDMETYNYQTLKNLDRILLQEKFALPILKNNYKDTIDELLSRVRLKL